MNDTLKKLQKETGIKQNNFDSEKNRMYNISKTILKGLEVYMKQVEELQMTNEQFFINFLDSVNAYSIKY